MADVTSTCTNNGGNAAPGQNPAPITVSGAVAIPAEEVKNGNTPFTIETEPPPSEIPGAPDCPNPNLGESTCACVIPKAKEEVTLAELRDFLRDKIAPHKLPDELCIMNDFPRLSGGVKINKFGKGGLAELAENDANRERHRK